MKKSESSEEERLHLPMLRPESEVLMMDERSESLGFRDREGEKNESVQDERVMHIANNKIICNIIIQSTIFILIIITLGIGHWYNDQGYVFGLVMVKNYNIDDSSWLFLSTFIYDQKCDQILNCDTLKAFFVAGILLFITLLVGVILNLYSVLHLANVMLHEKYSIFKIAVMMKVTFCVYIFGIVFWFFLSGAFLHFPNISYSFYLVLTLIFFSIGSTLYYYHSKNFIERKRLVKDLLGEEDTGIIMTKINET